MKNPYHFTKLHLGESRSGTLTSSKEEVEYSIEETFRDPSRDVALEGNHGPVSNFFPT